MYPGEYKTSPPAPLSEVRRGFLFLLHRSEDRPVRPLCPGLRVGCLPSRSARPRLPHHILWATPTPRASRYDARDGGWTTDRTGVVRMTGRWADVGEAARELGISTDAVRKRIARGSLESDKPNGTVQVWLGGGGTKAGREAGREAGGEEGTLVEALRAQVGILRSELDEAHAANRENRRIIAGLTQRIPELPAPAPEELIGGPQKAEEDDEQRAERERARELQRLLTEAREQLEEERSKGFWSRLFGGRR